MVVLEQDLKEVHDEIDLVTTTTGNLVAMAHSTTKQWKGTWTAAVC